MSQNVHLYPEYTLWWLSVVLLIRLVYRFTILSEEVSSQPWMADPSSDLCIRALRSIWTDEVLGCNWFVAVHGNINYYWPEMLNVILVRYDAPQCMGNRIYGKLYLKLTWQLKWAIMFQTLIPFTEGPWHLIKLFLFCNM